MNVFLQVSFVDVQGWGKQRCKRCLCQSQELQCRSPQTPLNDDGALQVYGFPNSKFVLETILLHSLEASFVSHFPTSHFHKSPARKA